MMMMMMMLTMKQSVELMIYKGNPGNWRNLRQCRFVHHKSHMNLPGIEPGPPWWEACD
jgi:hypothetical protein